MLVLVSSCSTAVEVFSQAPDKKTIDSDLFHWENLLAPTFGLSLPGELRKSRRQLGEEVLPKDQSEIDRWNLTKNLFWGWFSSCLLGEAPSLGTFVEWGSCINRKRLRYLLPSRVKDPYFVLLASKWLVTYACHSHLWGSRKKQKYEPWILCLKIYFFFFYKF